LLQSLTATRAEYDVTQLTATLTTATPTGAAISKIRPVARPSVPSIGLDSANSAGRRALEACIADKFARQYGAKIEQFFPFLLSLNVVGQLGAAAGLRLARQSDLFLEQYLDVPVEQAVSKVFRTPVDRAQIVEIGNLASAAPGSAALLFGLLPAILHEAGIRWVVCTATPQVQAMLEKLKFPSQTICAADPEVLGNKKTDWGSYYSNCPDVIVGDVQLAVTCAATNRAVGALMHALAAPISRIATTLKLAG
jgi:hypothetical protein